MIKSDIFFSSLLLFSFISFSSFKEKEELLLVLLLFIFLLNKHGLVLFFLFCNFF